MPFADDYADVAVAIHVLEHFYEWEAVDVLREWKRILKPGGKLIIELPCMDKVISYLVNCAKQNKPVFAQMSWFAFYGDPRYKNVEMTHKWGYSKQMLQSALEQAGFGAIMFEEPRYHLAQRDMRAIAINQGEK